MPDVETHRLLAQLARAQADVDAAKAALRERRQRRPVDCACGAQHPLGELHVIVTHFYRGPHGCTEGDTWHEGEWHFTCPVTSRRNRIMFDDYDVDWKQRDTIGVAAEPTFKRVYRGLFASMTDEYKHGHEAGSWNNYGIDQRRDDFELPLKKAAP